MPTLTVTAVANNNVSITLTAGGGETAFEIQSSRASDFASEDTFTFTGLAAGAHSIVALTAGTVWWFRTRKTNGGAGAWSAPVAAYVLAVAEPTTYAGFSVDKALVIVPEKFTAITSQPALAGFPASRLVRDDPTSVWRSYNAASIIDFDTAGQPIDCFALLGTNLNHNALWRVRGFASAAARTSNAGQTYDSANMACQIGGPLNRRAHYHSFHRSPTLRTEAFWRIDLFIDTPGLMVAQIRNLVVGRGRSSVNASRGQGSTPNDLGALSRNRFGAPNRTRGWRGRNMDVELSWLTEAEFEAKWRDLDRLVGTTDPVMIIPNSKANVHLNERIGFGAVRSMRDENVRSSRYSKSIEVESVY